MKQSKNLILLAILIFQTFGCQTLSTDGTTKNSADLDSQLAVVASFIDGGTPEKALREIKVILQSNPDDPKANNMMGLTQLALHNAQRAISYFQKSYQASPEIGTGLNLSASYIELGRYDDAEKNLKKLLALKKSSTYKFPERIYHNLGLVTEKKKNFKLAEKYYKRAIEENPTYYMSRFQLAKLYQITKRPNLAIVTMDEARHHCPICYEPVENLAISYKKAGKPEEAKKILAEFIKTDGIPAEDIARAKDLEKAIAPDKNQKL